MNQKSVVVMPTLNRPEMLALSLEKLRKCQAKDLDVRIYLDYCDKERLDEVDYVRDEFYPEATIFQAGQHISAPSGCWNILNALKQGYHTGADYIFLIEEDVMVYPEFFTWHLFKQKSQDWFATCGRRRYEYASDHYTNPGSCLSKDSLRQIVPHINDLYFKDRRGYLDRFFGVMDEASDLDDGLIRRVIRACHGKVAYPETPKCAHQGFSMYNRGQLYTVTGDIQERIKSVRRMLKTLKSSDRYTRDFEEDPNDSD